MSLYLVMQSIGCLSLALMRYELVTRQQELKGWDKKTLTTMISRGFSLCDLAKKANSAFGGIILTEYGVTLFYATFGIYFSTILFDVYDDKMERFNQLVLILSVMNITLVVFSIYRVYLMQANGQKLCDHFSAIKENLEDFSMHFSNKLEDEEARRLDVLISRFSSADSADSPIRPCDVFNLNTASFVSIGGIILTYLIVLLQFKLSANEDGNRFNLNIEDMPNLLGNRTLTEFIAFAESGTNTTLADWQKLVNGIDLRASINVSNS